MRGGRWYQGKSDDGGGKDASDATMSRASRACCLSLTRLRVRAWFRTSLSPFMASVSRLRTILQSAFGSRGLPNGEQEFFEELMAHKPQLVNLCDIGARNPQEQRELQTG